MITTYTNRLADLLVEFGANVQPDQVVTINSSIGKEELTRAVAASAYRRGATYVDVSYADIHIKRARILNSTPERLDKFPSWFADRVIAMGEQRCAAISLSGPVEPDLLTDLDQRLVGMEQSAPQREAGQVIGKRFLNWTIGPGPTVGWANQVYPDAESDDAALLKLWEAMAHVCRLDDADPVARWNERFAVLSSVRERLNAARFDSLRYSGPGTDFTVGLLPTSSWVTAAFSTADGLQHTPNIPSEEIFTTPDPMRADGVVRSTKPLVMGGTIIEGLEVEFREGRVVRVDATTGADALRAMVERDEGAARLGEVALVDGSGRIGPLNTVFYDTLLDENAASHIALGMAYKMCAEESDHSRVNESEIHVDFMIGSPEQQVFGVAADKSEVAVLLDGRWQL